MNKNEIFEVWEDKIRCKECGCWTYRGIVKHKWTCDYAKDKTYHKEVQEGQESQEGQTETEVYDGVIFEKIGNYIIAKGKTYGAKEHLKQDGFKWQYKTKVWKKEIIEAVKEGIGSTVCTDDDILELTKSKHISVSEAMNQDT